MRELIVNSDVSGKWSVSTDEELYHETYETEEEAVEGGKRHGITFWVGQCVAPVHPEKLFDRSSISQWLEFSVYEHADYLGEWAEGSVEPTDEQSEELAAEIRPLIAAWLDRHKLRPTHWNIDPKSVRKITV